MTNDGILALLLVLVGFILLGVLLYVVPSLIATWILYTNAKKPGWAAIVPVYQSVVMAQIAKKPEWMGWVVGIVPFANDLLGRLFGYVMGQDSIVTVVFALFSLVVSFGVLALAIVLLVGFIQQYRHKDGGSTVGFWVCYFLVPIAAVFMAKNIVGKDTALQSQQAAPTGSQPAPPYVPPAH